MLIVTGVITMHPESADAFRKAALVAMAETEKEEGCVTYRFWEDIGRPGVFRIYEEWESDAHLKAHFGTAHIAAFRGAMATFRDVSRKVVIIENFTRRSL